MFPVVILITFSELAHANENRVNITFGINKKINTGFNIGFYDVRNGLEKSL